MKISEWLKMLEKAKETYGDKNVYLIRSYYHRGGGPGLSDTGSGWVDVNLGSQATIRGLENNTIIMKIQT